MMRGLMALIGVALVAGCATPGDLRGKAPRYDTTSASPPEKVVGCIADLLEKEMNETNLLSRPTTNGYAITKNDAMVMWGPHAAYVLDIARAADKTRVAFYSNLAFNRDDEKIIAIIKRCG